MDQLQPVTSTSIVRLAAASAVGTTLEWYDFTIYNVMAALVFNVVFFPSFDPLTGTLLAFSTYAVGYFARPAGGFFFGRLGDRRGRRFVLIATLVLMGVATSLIGILPTYGSWGILSSAVLVMLRFIQGAAIGGEWAGAVLLAFEHGSPHHRGRNGAFASIGPACGTILGNGVIAVVVLALSPAKFENWGWRMPFLLSVVLVAFGLWLRRGVGETPIFVDLAARQATTRAPVKEVFQVHWRALLISIGVRIGPDVMYTLLVVFTLTYITTILHLSRSLALTAIMVGAACHAITIPFFASLSDRFGRRPLYATGALISMAWSYAYFALMDTAHPLLICLAVAGGLMIHATMLGPQAALIVEQFPAHVRYAGASLAYTLTGIVAGGVAPLILSAIYSASRSTHGLSLYVIASLAVTLIALWRAPETACAPLAE